MQRNVNIIKDLNGNNIVLINDIRFKGKRKINWKDVEVYLRKYTARLRGAAAKAKANAVQGIPELIQIAENRTYKENLSVKHKNDAKYGWYRYDSRFALPIYDDFGELERFNVFHARMLIRHDIDGKRYLYDIVNIKKETSTPLEL